MELPPSSLIKASLDRNIPWLYRPTRALRQRYASWRFNRRYRGLLATVAARTDGYVQTGPFVGMRYLEKSRSSALLPKILGTYEDELHPALENAMERPYTAIIDIGCAEGYYAVGLALRCPTATIFAYDQDPVARELCGELARRNGVSDRILVQGKFSPEMLNEIPLGRTLIVCDVEGYETELFNSSTADAWREADLIIELHDCLGVPCKQTVNRCLLSSHAIEIVARGAKVPPPISALKGLPEADRHLAVDELRPAAQEWLIARRLNS